MNLVQHGHIVVGVCVKQAAGHIAVQLIEVVRQITTFFEIQGTLQTNHNAAGTCNGFGLFVDILVLDMTTCCGQAFQQAIKQHLNQVHIVRRGNAAADFDIAVTLNGS